MKLGNEAHQGRMVPSYSTSFTHCEMPDFSLYACDLCKADIDDAKAANHACEDYWFERMKAVRTTWAPTRVIAMRAEKKAERTQDMLDTIQNYLNGKISRLKYALLAGYFLILVQATLLAWLILGG